MVASSAKDGNRRVSWQCTVYWATGFGTDSAEAAKAAPSSCGPFLQPWLYFGL